jgi:hypothetical protein
VLEDKASYISEQFNKKIIKPLVIMNFGEQEFYPELSHEPLGDTDLPEMSKVVADLLNSGAITKNSADEKYIRSIFGFPELSQEQEEKIDNPLVEEQEKKKSILKDQDCQIVSLQDYKPWRPLTLAEKRVNFIKLNEEFNNLEGEVKKGMAAITGRAVASLLSKIKKLLDAGDVAKIADIKIGSKPEIRKVINDVVKQSLAVGKSTASQEMSVKPPSTPSIVVQANKLESDLITDSYANSIEGESKGFIRDAVLTGATTAAIIAGLRSRLADKTAQMINNTAGTIVGQNINRGRDVVYQEYVQQIYALQRSEFLDSKTCSLCLSLDKRVVGMDDPMAELTLVHTNCRGIWTVVLVNDTELPPITGIPKSIVARFDLVGGSPIKNSFRQLKKPTNVKGNKEATVEIKKRSNA